MYIEKKLCCLEKKNFSSNIRFFPVEIFNHIKNHNRHHTRMHLKIKTTHIFFYFIAKLAYDFYMNFFQIFFYFQIQTT